MTKAPRTRPLPVRHPGHAHRRLWAGVALALAAGTTPAADGPGRAQAGVHVGTVTVKTANHCLKNAAKGAFPWRVRGTGELWDHLDAWGYPVSLPPDGLYALALSDEHPPGRYVLAWDGEGDVRLDGTGTGARIELLEDTPGRRVYEAAPADYVSLVVLDQQPDEPVRDIRLWLPGTDPGGSPWNPDWVRMAARFGVLRFQGMQQAGGAETGAWERVASPRQFSFVRAGRGVHPARCVVPTAWLIMLANEAGSDPWFTLPPAVDDTWVAAFVRETNGLLDPGRTIYVDLAREGPWAGRDDGAYERRCIELFRALRAASRHRLVTVICVDPSRPGALKQAKTRLERPGRCDEVDALGLSLFMGLGIGDRLAQPLSGATVDDVFDVLASMRGGEVARWMREGQAIAEALGLDLVVAAGGQHLATYRSGVAPEDHEAFGRLIAGANRDPRMGRLYQRHLADWSKSGGGLYCHFSLVDPAHHAAQWGRVESIGQPSESAPKMQAFLDWMNP